MVFEERKEKDDDDDDDDEEEEEAEVHHPTVPLYSHRTSPQEKMVGTRIYKKGLFLSSC